MVRSSTQDAQFNEMFNMHFESVRAYCMRRLPVADANDAAAEVFLIVWRKDGAVPDPQDALPWLFGIARNAVRHQKRNYARRSRMRRKVQGLGLEEMEGLDVQLLRADADREVTESMTAMSDGDREVLRLRYWEELTAAEIGAVLGISTAAAEKRARRALRRLERTMKRRRVLTDAHSLERGGERNGQLEAR